MKPAKFFGRIRTAVLEGCRKIGRFLRRIFRRLLAVLTNRTVRNVAVLLLSGVLFLVLSVFSISLSVKNKTDERILTVSDLQVSDLQFDCVLILGCGVYADGSPSPMLTDRMLTGIEVMQAGVTDRMLVSGDHRTDAYNEVGVMKQFAVDAGIRSTEIFQDHDGYSTYDSIVRAKKIFGARRIVIVSQEYHLYRALYLAEKLGMDAVGICADRRPYRNQLMYELRETVARCKDVFYGLKQPDPTVLGDVVALSGNGDRTEEVRPVANT